MKNQKNQNINSIMQFNGYDVLKISYEKNLNKSQFREEYDVHPQFFKEVTQKDEDSFSVILGFKIESTDDNPFPFTTEIIMEGKFQSIGSVEKDDKIKLMNENSLAILFPYLRSVVSMVTVSANETALLLPTFNIINFFKEHDNEDQKISQN